MAKCAFPLAILALCMITSSGTAQQVSHSQEKDSGPRLDDREEVIKQLESDLLTAERNTDPVMLDRIFADDWLNLSPTGLGSNKIAVLSSYRDHAGAAPPYTVSTKDMRIYDIGDLAVATYVKIYRARENNNLAQHDITDVFSKLGGVWKLRITRTTVRTEQ